MLAFGLRQLEHFVHVADSGSFRAAAEIGFIAQPALSMSIRKLEEALGVTLFERGARGVTLTTAGRAFLADARRSLLHAQQGQQSARLAERGEWGVVRLGFVGSAAYRYLPSRLPAFIAAHPGVTVELIEGTTASLVEMIRDGRVDAGVIRMPLDEAAGLHLEEVETDDLVAVLPARHAHARRARIDLAALADEPFVMFSRTQVPGLSATVLDVCRDAGFTPRRAQEVTQAFTMVGLVGSGLGVALVPGVITRFAHEHVRFVRLSNARARQCLTLAFAIRSEGASEATLRLYESMTRGVPPAT
jgi:DNA-binding transcriptional LysR family regulator